ncbi:MAG: hypothetical protein E6J34_21495 [Chloroflexi bacterium]|nr:MAG: hypothetical protein E6J34_21495 [Chloroflexota bacterium]
MSATEITKRFNISHGTCHNNILPQLQAYFLPGRRRPVYKLVDIEALSQVRVVDPVEKMCSDVEQGERQNNLAPLCRLLNDALSS